MFIDDQAINDYEYWLSTTFQIMGNMPYLFTAEK